MKTQIASAVTETLLYHDNAATSQKPRAVIDALSRYYERDNANVHRGIHELSNRATAAFEAARVRAAQFLNARSADEIIFTRGTTEGRAKLRTVSKYVPPQEQSLALMYGTLLNAGDEQFDELKMATIWIVSPPDVGGDAEPDETWTPYPQHFAFWNLQHASRLIPPRAPSKPLQLHTGLAGGIGDSINDTLLSFVNDAYAEAEAFLNQADARGIFWST